MPFRHGEATREGVDCAGLVLAAARDAGLAVPPLPRYGRDVAPKVLLSTLEVELTPVWYDPVPERFGARETEEGWAAARPGDVIVLGLASSHGQPHPRHLGLWTGTSLVHAHEKHGVIETPLDEKTRQRLHSVWRFKELTDG